ncbi:MAG: hypothetical protein WDZ41_00640 [Candidatus Babeliales bacterium]
MKKNKLFTVLLSIFVLSSININQTMQAFSFGSLFTKATSSFSEKIKNISGVQLIGAAAVTGIFCLAGYKLYRYWGKPVQKQDVIRIPQDDEKDRSSGEENKLDQNNGQKSEREDSPSTLSDTVLEKDLNNNSVENSLSTEEKSDHEKKEGKKEVDSPEQPSKNLEWLNKLATGKKQKKNRTKQRIRWRDEKEKVEAYFKALIQVVDKEVNEIEQRLMRKKVKPGKSGLDGLEKTLNALFNQIKNLYSNISEETAKYKEIISQKIKKLNEVKNSVSKVTERIAIDDVSLFEHVDNQLSYLEKVEIQKDKVYQQLFGEGVKWNQKTLKDINEKCDECTDEQQLLGKQYRQIRYFIGDEWSKEIYDAWLQDKQKGIKENGCLGMIRISLEEAEKYGLNFMDLSTQLITINNALSDLNKLMQ